MDKVNGRDILNKNLDVGSIIEQKGICEKCGGKLIERKGRYGEFLACENFPKCKYIDNI